MLVSHALRRGPSRCRQGLSGLRTDLETLGSFKNALKGYFSCRFYSLNPFLQLLCFQGGIHSLEPDLTWATPWSQQRALKIEHHPIYITGDLFNNIFA